MSKLTELLRHMADDSMGMEPGDRQVLSDAANHIEALEAQLDRTCEWSVSAHRDNEYWSSSCGDDWMFIDGGPEENSVRFCQGCGGKVVLAAQEAGE
jgi:hypothetical protein